MVRKIKKLKHIPPTSSSSSSTSPTLSDAGLVGGLWSVHNISLPPLSPHELPCSSMDCPWLQLLSQKSGLQDPSLATAQWLLGPGVPKNPKNPEIY